MVVFEKSLEKSAYESNANATSADDRRLGSFFRQVELKSIPKSKKNRPIVLMGHPDDQGVSLNNGRPGSAQAPQMIRGQLFKLSPGQGPLPPLYDIGDSRSNSTSLAKRQTEIMDHLMELYSFEPRVICLGGGHDHAYVDVGAWLKSHIQSTKQAPKKYRPLVVNIDAHLDMRPLINGPTSGTPFYQLLEEFNGEFDLLAVGIQSFSSSQQHLAYAKSKKAKVKMFLDCVGKLDKIFQVEAKKKRSVFISVDIDCFSASYAPGCSAPTTIGLDAAEFLVAMSRFVKKIDASGFGIYEVNPKFDLDNRTTRLAAQLIHGYITHV